MDFSFANHGTICLLRPISQPAQKWAAAEICPDHLSLGGAIAIEPRYVGPILEGIAEAGLEVN